MGQGRLVKRRTVDLKNATMIEVAYARTGSMLKAARVVAFIQAWAQVRSELGREPTVAEYEDYWRESTSSAYRHLREFRQVFTKCETPGPLLDELDRQRANDRDRLDLTAVASLSPAVPA